MKKAYIKTIQGLITKTVNTCNMDISSPEFESCVANNLESVLHFIKEEHLLTDYIVKCIRVNDTEVNVEVYLQEKPKGYYEVIEGIINQETKDGQ